MLNKKFIFDESKSWTKNKLEIFKKYYPAYIKAFNKKGKNLEKYYIDAFSGPGILEKRYKSVEKILYLMSAVILHRKPISLRKEVL